jgi:hypothetical protein
MSVLLPAITISEDGLPACGNRHGGTPGHTSAQGCTGYITIIENRRIFN